MKEETSEVLVKNPQTIANTSTSSFALASIILSWRKLINI